MDVMDTQTTYNTFCSSLGYDKVVANSLSDTVTPTQRYLFSELRRYLPDIQSVYFVGDTPVIYFSLLSNYDKEKVKEIHRLVWNQGRAPMLCVVSPSEVRIYNCFEKPLKPGLIDEMDSGNRLVELFAFTDNLLDEFKLNEFSRLQIETGAFWNGPYGQKFRNDNRVDASLLKNLRLTRERLNSKLGLGYDIIHDLLGRSIFMLYLEDRGAVAGDYYARFIPNATTFFDILRKKDALYALFDDVTHKFNGDMFPITPQERQKVEEQHLDLIADFFLGAEMITGQMRLWRPYDFSVIPIEFVSVIYERFLHKKEGASYISSMGAYYTPQALVEFVLNEVLPWPSIEDHDYSKTILDPACGSGIFLVEGYRRLVARWMYANHTSTVEPEVLNEILVHSIYGVDINPDAIRVAAFSLYLALLDHLEPKTIWESLRFPRIVYQADDLGHGGSNLYPLSTFSLGDFLSQKQFDLVVGNPPWKRDGLPEDVAEYCRTQGFGQESAQAFMWRARDFVDHDKGRIALVATSKILFNSEKNDRRFRQRLFSENYVEIVVNFSALRKSDGSRREQFFASAVGPATVFFFRVTPPQNARSTLLYCSPKQTRIDDVVPGVVIEASEFKFLPRSEIAEQDYIWKVAMWGTQRDLDIIKKVMAKPNLARYISDKQGWDCGRGLQRPGDGADYEPRIYGLPLIETDQVTRYWLENSDYKTIDAEYFFRAGTIETYNSPHILFKRGLQDKRLCAAYCEFDCAFHDSIIGIFHSQIDTTLLKALTAFLNSAFVSYYLFMTTSMWGVERDRINKAELLSLPGIVFDASRDVQVALASQMDKLRIALKDKKISDITHIEQEINRLVYEMLALSRNAQFVIDDTLTFGLSLFQDGRKSVACMQIDASDLDAYAQILCDEINKILLYGKTTAWATVYRGNTPLRIVAVHFNNAHTPGSLVLSDIPDELSRILSRLDRKMLAEHSESVYIRRNLKIYDGDTVYIVKPDERRLWSRSMALRDADDILAEGVSRAITI